VCRNRITGLELMNEEKKLSRIRKMYEKILENYQKYKLLFILGFVLASLSIAAGIVILIVNFIGAL